MNALLRAPAVLAALLCAAPAAHAEAPGQAIHCDSCAAWNQPQAPFKLVGNTWYVGTRELSAVLVTTPKGHVLLDGALRQSAPLIAKNIEALGFRLKDVKYILNSHAHFDHAGGIPALQKASGATVVASRSGAAVLRAGTIGPDDPQFDAARPFRLAPVRKVKSIGDGETLRLGELVLTAHLTPGHTPGSTTWSWQSCEGGRCYDVVYADSLNPVSLGDFRYSGDATHPDISASFEASIAKVAALECDVVVSVHPGFTDTLGKLAATTASHNAFLAPGGCREYAADASRRLEKRLAEERAPAPAAEGARP